MKTTYSILICPHCKKFVGADLFRLQDLNAAKRARFTEEQIIKAKGKRKKK